MRDALNMMCRYNRWMNEKLLDACSAISDEERKADRGAPFRSIHGIWNHLLLADRMWMGRFGREPFTARSLDQILYDDWEELKYARDRVDGDIENWISEMTDEDLEGELTVVRLSNPTPIIMPYCQAALHVFNHQTHHRGQITALLEQAGGDCGVTDLGAMPVAVD